MTTLLIIFVGPLVLYLVLVLAVVCLVELVRGLRAGSRQLEGMDPVRERGSFFLAMRFE